MEFADRLQELIDNKKISQAYLADGIGVQRSRVTEWLNGKPKKPIRRTLVKIADFFHCDVEWLATGEGIAYQEVEGIPKSIGKRLGEVSWNTSTQTLADAIGINKSHIESLLNGQYIPDLQHVLYRIAEYLHCNPVWLESGIGECFDENLPIEKKYIPAHQRLAFLKGKLSTKKFAKACDIDEERMQQYLDGTRLSDEDVYKVVKKLNTSIGWLTCAEGWKGDNRFTGLSTAKHLELGEKIYELHQFMERLAYHLHFSYPLEGKLSRPQDNAFEISHLLSKFRSNLEENYYEDDKDNFSTHTYYPANRLKEKKAKEETDKNIHNLVPTPKKTKNQEIIESWVSQQDDGLDYWEILKGKLANESPDFKEWLKEQQLEKKEATGTDN